MFAACRGWDSRKLLFKAYNRDFNATQVIDVSANTTVRITAASAAALDNALQLDGDRYDTWEFQSNQLDLTRIGGVGAYERYLSLSYHARKCLGFISGGRCYGSWTPYRVEICAGPSVPLTSSSQNRDYLFCVSSSLSAVSQGMRIGTTSYGNWTLEVFAQVPAD
jgi:hypothetical protein